MVMKCKKGFEMGVPDDIEIEKKSHGYLVTKNFGNKEVDFFDEKKQAEKFVEEELRVCIKRGKK